VDDIKDGVGKERKEEEKDKTPLCVFLSCFVSVGVLMIHQRLG
jgi:hypothetical protein